MFSGLESLDVNQTSPNGIIGHLMQRPVGHMESTVITQTGDHVAKSGVVCPISTVGLPKSSPRFNDTVGQPMNELLHTVPYAAPHNLVSPRRHVAHPEAASSKNMSNPINAEHGMASKHLHHATVPTHGLEVDNALAMRHLNDHSGISKLLYSTHTSRSAVLGDHFQALNSNSVGPHSNAFGQIGRAHV